jgi:hypothetical protein
MLRKIEKVAWYIAAIVFAGAVLYLLGHFFWDVCAT